MCVAIGAGLSFAAITFAVLSEAALTVDIPVLLMLRLSAEGAPAWLTESARDLTALGSNGVLGLLTVLGSSLLVLWRRRREAVLLLVVSTGVVAIVALVKSLVARPRPELVAAGARVFTTSFPSSHAAFSASLCTIAALLLVRRVDRAAARGAAIAAVLVAGFVGLSRLYLGVHWSSDVVAGWALGLSWAALCWAIAAW